VLWCCADYIFIQLNLNIDSFELLNHDYKSFIPTQGYRAMTRIEEILITIVIPHANNWLIMKKCSLN
jgi:hypothetical protein